ncbi:MAG TPA: OmpH family outer membrane protein [Bacteroidales bacterium]|nr:OmpH family outer membrane protein [Bacteroidales bacterium]HPS71141.1 OmpH family outer membrane protein [Bacteroidales bacterium]
MKKRTIILVLLLTGLFATSFAQSKAKFGHIDYGAIIKLIPGVDTAQTVLETFQKDLQTEGEQMAAEFKKKNAEYEALASNPSTAPAILKFKKDDLEKQYKKIEDFSNLMQEEIQKKQLELLKPFQDALIKAIEKVAKEGNFIYIFDTSTLISYDRGEDIGPKVKEALGIKP